MLIETSLREINSNTITKFVNICFYQWSSNRRKQAILYQKCCNKQSDTEQLTSGIVYIYSGPMSIAHTYIMQEISLLITYFY